MGGPGSGRKKGSGSGKRILPASMRKVQTPAQQKRTALKVRKAAFAKQNAAYNTKVKAGIKKGYIV